MAISSSGLLGRPPEPYRTQQESDEGRPFRKARLRFVTYLGIDARALEVAVEMTFAVLVALFKQPAIAAFRIGQDLPAIIVAIPKEETVGAVLEMRLGDFLAN